MFLRASSKNSILNTCNYSAIAYALFKLWDFFKDDKFYDVGEKALKYDQALFTPSKQYWKKTLTVTGDIHHSWGNGSAGIGLSRLLISKYYSNDIMHKEFSERDVADEFLSKILPNKLAIWPFISVQSEFGYSDVTGNNAQTGMLRSLFENTYKRFERYNAIKQRINQ